MSNPTASGDHIAGMSARVLSTFAGANVERGRVSPFYVAGLALSLAVLVAVMLAYFAMIVGCAWFVWWHFLTHTGWLVSSATGSRHGGLCAYLAVGAAGGVMLLFLLKPIFAPRASEPQLVTIDERSEPALFNLIQCICNAVRSPLPREVRLDCRVNASAGLRRGIASIMGNDLSLTIGMPLVAGLSARQFAGVLAHEFGHFTQGAGMSLSYLVRTLNAWFMRVVYERDRFDEWLASLVEDESWELVLAGRVLSAGVWCERKVLEGLLIAGGMVSGFMSRQMEFDADRCEALVAGSRAFEATMARFRTLQAAQDLVLDDAQELLARRELPDNVPVMVARRERSLPADLHHKASNISADEPTHWWSTHPSDAQRIAAVREINAPGVFNLDEPASHLFRDFAALSRIVSVYWYEAQLDLDLDHVRLLGVDEAEESQADHAARQHAVQTFFGGVHAAHRTLPVPMAAPEEWTAAAEHTRSWCAEYARTAQQEVANRDTLMLQSAGVTMLDAGFTVNMLSAFFPGAALDSMARQQFNATVRDHARLVEKLRYFEKHAWTRIAAALAWKFNDGATSDAWRQRVMLLVPAQRALARACEILEAAEGDRNAAAAIVTHASLHSQPERIDSIMRGHVMRAMQAMSAARSALDGTPDPHSTSGATLAKSLWVENPDDPEAHPGFLAFGPFAHATQVHLERTSGDLCLLAHEIEESWTTAAATQHLTRSLHAAQAMQPGWAPA